MEEKFNLSNKRIKDFTDQTIKYHERDVKEFIRQDNNLIRAVLEGRLTKEEFWDLHNSIIGDKLK